jgi:Na+-translocating ferredoxin:NAD+ oxidoreductase RnfD subunit
MSERMPQDRNCKHCGEEYDSSEIERCYGKESSVYIGGFCSAQCYTQFSMSKRTDMLDALNNPIFIGKKYGYSCENSGCITVVTGECIKAVRKDEYEARVTLKVLTAGTSVYSKPIEPDPWRTKKTVSVKPNKLFPIC